MCVVDVDDTGRDKELKRQRPLRGYVSRPRHKSLNGLAVNDVDLRSASGADSALDPFREAGCKVCGSMSNLTECETQPVELIFRPLRSPAINEFSGCCVLNDHPQ